MPRRRRLPWWHRTWKWFLSRPPLTFATGYFKALRARPARFASWLVATLGGVLLWYLAEFVANQFLGTRIEHPAFDVYITTAALALSTTAYAAMAVDRPGGRREGRFLAFLAMLAFAFVVALFTAHRLVPAIDEASVTRVSLFVMIGSLLVSGRLYLHAEDLRDPTKDREEEELDREANREDVPIKINAAGLPKVDSGANPKQGGDE